MSSIAILRPDSKGRVTLGALSNGVSSYHMTINKDKSILLEPYAEIPAREKWLFENPVLLEQVRRGLEDSANEKLKTLGDFSQ